jgi:hypothetical protein
MIGIAVPIVGDPTIDPLISVFTTYPVIGLPPFDVGGLKLTIACAFPPTAEGLSGCVGTVICASGVTAFDGADATLGPAELTASPVKV